MTKNPAIVVTVEGKRNDLPPNDRLPESLECFPVDVRQAGAADRLRATDPAMHSRVSAQLGLSSPALRFRSSAISPAGRRKPGQVRALRPIRTSRSCLPTPQPTARSTRLVAT